MSVRDSGMNRIHRWSTDLFNSTVGTLPLQTWHQIPYSSRNDYFPSGSSLFLCRTRVDPPRTTLQNTPLSTIFLSKQELHNFTILHELSQTAWTTTTYICEEPEDDRRFEDSIDRRRPPSMRSEVGDTKPNLLGNGGTSTECTTTTLTSFSAHGPHTCSYETS